MNRTIRNEVRELILQLVCVDINRLSRQSQAEVRHIAGMEPNQNNNEEMLEVQIVGHNHNHTEQIGTQQAIQTGTQQANKGGKNIKSLN